MSEEIATVESRIAALESELQKLKHDHHTVVHETVQRFIDHTAAQQARISSLRGPEGARGERGPQGEPGQNGMTVHEIQAIVRSELKLFEEKHGGVIDQHIQALRAEVEKLLAPLRAWLRQLAE